MCLGFNSDEGSFEIPFKSQTISTFLKSANFTAEILFLINLGVKNEIF